MLKHKPTQGFTLLELLIALVLLSLGILGLMGMQTNLMRGAAENSQRSVAIFLGQEMLDRIRANSQSANVYRTSINGLSCATVPSVCGASPNTCTSSEMATRDVWEVLCEPSTSVEFLNLQGASLVCGGDASNDCDTGDPAVLTLTWATKNLSNDGTLAANTSTFTLASRL